MSIEIDLSDIDDCIKTRYGQRFEANGSSEKTLH